MLNTALLKKTVDFVDIRLLPCSLLAPLKPNVNICVLLQSVWRNMGSCPKMQCLELSRQWSGQNIVKKKEEDVDP